MHPLRIAALVAVLIASALDPAAAQPCGGDCDADGRVVVSELVTGVNFALGRTDRPIADLCPSIDRNDNYQVTVNELVGAVNDALQGCSVAGASFGFCADRSEAVEARINALLPQMTLAEKIAQMHGLQNDAINGLYHTPGNERLGIPGLRMVDGPRGVRAGNATAFPVAMARGATWDPDLEQRIGAAIGQETRAKGGSVVLGPTINLLRHPRWGRAQETYGEDPLHLGRMGTGFTLGAQQYVIASAKHFALNSIEDTRFNVDVTVDQRTLREIYLPHFRMVVQDGHVGSIMSAYNQVNGAYCAENAPLLHDILKGEWGFDGLVESDWFVGTRSAVGSIRAGLDIEMPQAAWYGNILTAAVESGEVPVRLINMAVRRILRTTLCFQLDTNPPQIDPSLVETLEHTSLAREAEEKAIVLLRNQDALLPLTAGALTSIAVVGPLADQPNLGDVGSSNVTPSYVITPLAGIRAQAPGATVTHIVDLPFSEADRAVIAAADVVIVVVGLTAQDEGEAIIIFGGDRDGMALPRNQDTLIAAVAALNSRTAVILEGGSAITMDPWIESVAAVLMAWYPGQEGGHAIANILFGAANPLTGRLSPSGKLPITFPRAESDLPPFINDQNAVTYDYYHGYRYVDRHDIAPLFPFGFGLSYTTFTYANLALSSPTMTADGSVDVSFDLANTGQLAGQEIAQVYVSTSGSRVDRPVRDLRGFARVALAAGATQRVTVPLHARDLAFYDTNSGTWEVETITYTVHVGSSSRDLPLTAPLSVTN